MRKSHKKFGVVTVVTSSSDWLRPSCLPTNCGDSFARAPTASRSGPDLFGHERLAALIRRTQQFPRSSTPDRALAAALRVRNSVRGIKNDLLIKIGIDEGPCLAAMLHDRLDYFGQTVNAAARVQGLADSLEPIEPDTQILDSGIGLTAPARAAPKFAIFAWIKVWRLPVVQSSPIRMVPSRH